MSIILIITIRLQIVLSMQVHIIKLKYVIKYWWKIKVKLPNNAIYYWTCISTDACRSLFLDACILMTKLIQTILQRTEGAF